MELHPVFEALRRSSDACACSALRKATRVAAQMYDRHLAPSGVTTAQFSVLAALYYTSNIPMKRLAARLVMDRTSLTRVLAPLEKQDLIEIRPGEKDRRVKTVTLTAVGLEKLVHALPFWQEAQATMERELGGEGVARLRLVVQDVVTAARAGGATL